MSDKVDLVAFAEFVKQVSTLKASRDDALRLVASKRAEITERERAIEDGFESRMQALGCPSYTQCPYKQLHEERHNGGPGHSHDDYNRCCTLCGREG